MADFAAASSTGWERTGGREPTPTLPGVEYGWQLTQTGVTAPGLTGVLARGGPKTGGFAVRGDLPLQGNTLSSNTTYTLKRFECSGTSFINLAAMENVTFDRCWINVTGALTNTQGSAVALANSTGVTLVDCDVTGTGVSLPAQPGKVSAISSAGATGFRLRRCLFHCGSQSYSLHGNSTGVIEDCYSTVDQGAYLVPSDTHRDGFIKQDGATGSLLFQRCLLNADDDFITGAFFLQDLASPGIRNVTLQDSLLSGNGYNLVTDGSKGNGGLNDLAFRNVRFDSRGFGPVGHDVSGINYGVITTHRWEKMHLYNTADPVSSADGGRKGTTLTLPAGNSATIGSGWQLTGSATTPSSPRITGVTMVNNDATVTFDAPTDTGGSAITGYRVTAGGVTATGTSSPITVLGVSVSEVELTVAATNAVGYGGESKPWAVAADIGGSPVIEVLGDGSDLTYLTSAVGPVSQTFDLTLEPINPPAGDFVVTVRAARIDAVSASIVGTLRDGATVVATAATVNPANTVGNLTVTFTAASIAGVTTQKWAAGTLVVRLAATAT